MTDIMIYIKALQKVHGELTELLVNKTCARRASLQFRVSTDTPSLDLWIFKIDDASECAMEQTCAYFPHDSLDQNIKNVADFKQRAENLINTYLKG